MMMLAINPIASRARLPVDITNQPRVAGSAASRTRWTTLFAGRSFASGWFLGWRVVIHLMQVLRAGSAEGCDRDQSGSGENPYC
jgi:hypothetical protein